MPSPKPNMLVWANGEYCCNLAGGPFYLTVTDQPLRGTETRHCGAVPRDGDAIIVQTLVSARAGKKIERAIGGRSPDEDTVGQDRPAERIEQLRPAGLSGAAEACPWIDLNQSGPIPTRANCHIHLVAIA